MKKGKTSQTALLAGAIVVLVAALGLGFGVRKVRQWRAEAKAAEQVAEAGAENTSQTHKTSVRAEGLQPETVEHQEYVEAAEPEQEAQELAAEPATMMESSNEAQQVGQSAYRRYVMSNGQIDWQRLLADLNLTPEEMARLGEGWRLARQRWQNMSEEERQGEIGRMQGMRTRWQSMSDEERQAAFDRNMQRFEDWRASGSVELPQLSLD